MEECRATVQHEIQVALDPATVAPPPSTQHTHGTPSPPTLQQHSPTTVVLSSPFTTLSVSYLFSPPALPHSTPASIPGRAATMPAVGSMASWRATLWTRLETLADNMEKTFVKVQQLRVVLEKRRDPVTQESLLEQIREVSTDGDMHASMWQCTVHK